MMSGYGKSFKSVDQCCLTENGERCSRLPGNYTFTKSLQKTVQQSNDLKLEVDQNAQYANICTYHKDEILKRKFSRKVSRKRREEETVRTSPVDFNQMPLNTLKRYKKHYKLQIRPGFTKIHLAQAVSKHFVSIPIGDSDEKELLTYFIHLARTIRAEQAGNRLSSPGRDSS